VTATSGTIGSFTIGTYLYTGSKTSYSDSNTGVHLGSDGIALGPYANFSVDPNGYLISRSGAIGAFNISNAHLYTGSKTLFNDNLPGVHVGSDGIGLGAAFKVDAAGNLTATNVAISGAITATSGNITAALQANSITAAMLQAGSVTAGKIDAGAVTAGTIAANAVTSGTISAGAITAGKIATDAIVSQNIQAGEIKATNIGAGEVTASKISVSQLSAISANMGTLTAGAINGGSIQIGSSCGGGGSCFTVATNGLLTVGATATFNSIQVTSLGSFGAGFRVACLDTNGFFYIGANNTNCHSGAQGRVGKGWKSYETFEPLPLRRARVR
jgi:hypothetical protein